MRVFVSEYVCSGAWPQPVLPASLAREGRAMLLALVADLAAMPDVTVCTTWDARLGEFPRLETLELRAISECAAMGINPVAQGAGHPRVECTVVTEAHHENETFRRLASECDATYVIAPELDDLLTQRVQLAQAACGRCLNASPAVVRTCSDKWETFQLLARAGIPTVPTQLFDAGTAELPFEFPLVIKLRFGAGSQDTFLVRNRAELAVAATNFNRDQPTTEAIVQPFVAGRSLSFVAIFQSDGKLREVWPLGEQRLSDDGRFRYRGGRVGGGILDFGYSILDLIERMAAAVPGLRGYVGFDLIVRDGSEGTPLIVDINPRLTTSYLGYRVLARGNLAGRVLWPDAAWPNLDWHNVSVEFDALGVACRADSDHL